MRNALRSLLPCLALLCFASACGGAQTPVPAGATSILGVNDVPWTPLNPARRDASPQAGTIWGDRGENTATGFLVRFVDGFSSPPHIHNVSYRAVVIEGLIHNDDPGAAKMWMPPGSFWTQPKGETHITAAQGDSNVAYVEIDAGPYLVQPQDDEFATQERPINIDPSNFVWLDASAVGLPTHTGWSINGEGAQAVLLWGSVELGFHGSFVKLPAGSDGDLTAHAGGLRVVVIQGDWALTNPSVLPDKPLAPGSTFVLKEGAQQGLRSLGSGDGVLYLRYEGRE